MYVIVTKSVLFLFCATTILAKSLNKYDIERAKILEDESKLQVGGHIELNDEENAANDILMRFKEKEVDESFHNPKYFNFSKHYFSYKNDIGKSNVYQIIRMMPKGAALHVHSSLMLSTERLLALTYEDHLYACFADGDLKLRFSNTVPQRPCPVNWQLLSELRNASDDLASFDNDLKKHFTMYSQDVNDMKHDINFAWRRFDKVCHVTKDLIAYRPVREKFFYQALKEFYDDNIMYIEVRSGLSILYELDGTEHDMLFMPRLYQRVAKKFKEDYPEFIGIKLIVTSSRGKNVTQVQKTLEVARKVKAEMFDMFAGFDLVGQEDLGKPLVEMHPALSLAKNDMNFYFHGGETNWSGVTSDENLVDAILLGTKRIGHGYALLKHPTLMAAVRTKDIAIEVNVISNVVLSLICDVRNHPLAAYLAYGMPVVISSDDPGAWGADPLSHDFYVAFVGVASKKADLRMLKQLVINSVKYSALDTTGKCEMLKQLQGRWDEFVKNVIETYR